eukprot:sb/3474052/
MQFSCLIIPPPMYRLPKIMTTSDHLVGYEGYSTTSTNSSSPPSDSQEDLLNSSLTNLQWLQHINMSLSEGLGGVPRRTIASSSSSSSSSSPSKFHLPSPTTTPPTLPTLPFYIHPLQMDDRSRHSSTASSGSGGWGSGSTFSC